MEELQPLQTFGASLHDTKHTESDRDQSVVWIPQNNASLAFSNDVEIIPSTSKNHKNYFVSVEFDKKSKIDVAWRNLSYVVNQKKKNEKWILRNISGQVKSGDLTAIMGPSGAGKTTLLNILAGYARKHVSGELIVNGTERNLQQFKKKFCYIMQEDLTLPYLSVEEAVMFAASLKLPQRIPKHEKKIIVHDIIKSLGLTECLNTKGRCLSGGQRRRLTIAQELVNNPPVIFLDEPTSGIDSSSCIQCIKLLKMLAEKGRNVVCTIHQPNLHVFEQFDKLYMLADGRCIYQGPTCELLPFLSAHELHCPPYCNPAEFITEIACGTYNVKGKKLFNTDYLEKETGQKNDKSECIDDPSNETYVDKKQKKTFLAQVNLPPFRKKVTSTEYSGFPTSAFNQFCVILHRTILSMSRDPLVTHLRLVTNIIVGILIGLLYYKIGDDADKVYNNAGLLFFSQLLLLFTSMMPTLLTFPLDMCVFVKEHLNCWYSIKMYYLAKTTVDLPFQIVFPVIYISIVYWMTSQPPDVSRFLLILLLSVLTSMVAQSVGLLIGALGSIQAAVFLGPVSVIPALLFSGYFITLHSIPWYLKFMSYVSYVRFSFEGTMQSVYGFNRTDMLCDTEPCIFTNPADFLTKMELDDADVQVDVVALTIYFLFLRIFGYFALKLKLALREW